eukprot:UN20434
MVRLDRYEDILDSAENSLLPPESPSKLDNIVEIFIQYGYVTLFALAFPLTPLLAFINNLLEIYIDSYKLVTYRRPFPKANIGMDKSWLLAFSVVSKT